MLALEDVTPENYAEATLLAVAPEQRHLVSPVVASLADCPRVAREDGGRLVGFVLAYPFTWEGRPVVNIVRFLVDQKHQGRGLGRELLQATLAWWRAETPRPARFRVTTKVENARAEHVFRSCGFSGDDVVRGERVLWRDA